MLHTFISQCIILSFVNCLILEYIELLIIEEFLIQNLIVSDNNDDELLSVVKLKIKLGTAIGNGSL